MNKLRIVKGSPSLSLQGEGVLIGTPSIFLRTAGCDLRCERDGGRGFTCDAPNSLLDYDHDKLNWVPLTRHAYEIDPKELASIIVTMGTKNLVITGGEPLLQADLLSDLLSCLVEVKHIFTMVETNARHFDDIFAMYIDMPSFSPKLNHWSDKEETALSSWFFHCAYYGKPCQLKIVCSDKTDYEHAKSIFSWAKNHVEVECIIQPAYDNSDYNELSNLVMMDSDSYIRLIPQVHKFIGLSQ